MLFFEKEQSNGYCYQQSLIMNIEDRESGEEKKDLFCVISAQKKINDNMSFLLFNSLWYNSWNPFDHLNLLNERQTILKDNSIHPHQLKKIN